MTLILQESERFNQHPFGFYLAPIFNNSCCRFSSIRLNYQDNLGPLFTPAVIFINNMGLSTSLYTTMVISIDRYLAVCKPFFAQRGRVQGMFLCSVVAFSLLWSTFLLSFQLIDNDATTLAALHVSSSLHKLIPSSIMAILTYPIIRQIKKSQRFQAEIAAAQRREIQSTKMFLIIILVSPVCYWFTNVIHGTYAVYNLIMPDPEPDMMFLFYLVVFSSNAYMFNSSCNFFIYLWNDADFRAILGSFIFCCCKAVTSRSNQPLSNKTSKPLLFSN